MFEHYTAVETALLVYNFLLDRMTQNLCKIKIVSDDDDDN